MMETSDELTARPSSARMYDYYLGGFHHFEIDRQAAEQVMMLYPDVRSAAHVNRAFLRRAVAYLCQQGIDQFLDIGSGIPTVGNVHEVAQSLNPAARIVYVDIDSVAVQHSQELLRDNPNALALQGDIRTPDALVQHPDVQRLLDFTRPIGLLLIAILPFVPDDAQAFAIVTTLRHALVEGSYIVITHGSKENVDPAVLQQIENLYTKTNAPARYRPQAIIERFFQGLDFIDPGLVPLPIWRPDSPDDLWVDQPQRAAVVGGIGQVR